jgi:hypothetical protein
LSEPGTTTSSASCLVLSPSSGRQSCVDASAVESKAAQTQSEATTVKRSSCSPGPLSALVKKSEIRVNASATAAVNPIAIRATSGEANRTRPVTFPQVELGPKRRHSYLLMTRPAIRLADANVTLVATGACVGSDIRVKLLAPTGDHSGPGAEPWGRAKSQGSVGRWIGLSRGRDGKASA